MMPLQSALNDHIGDEQSGVVTTFMQYRRQSSLPLDTLKNNHPSVRNVNNLNLTDNKNVVGNTMPNRMVDQKLYKSIDSIRQDLTMESRDDVTENNNQNGQYYLDHDVSGRDKQLKAFNINDIARFNASDNQLAQKK